MGGAQYSTRREVIASRIKLIARGVVRGAEVKRYFLDVELPLVETQQGEQRDMRRDIPWSSRAGCGLRDSRLLVLAENVLCFRRELARCDSG